MLPEPWLKEVGDQVVRGYIEDDRHSSISEMSQVKHVIEHKIATPRQQQNPYQLPPIQQPQPPPQIVPMQQPQPPAIIQGPAPQHIFTTGYQQPIIHNLGGGAPQENKQQGMFNKADFGEMMMMQNCQMHQMVMQKLMLGNLGGSHQHQDCHDCHNGCCSSHGYYGSCYDCVPRINPGGAVHHHHYSSPPPSQPAIHHYTSLPAMDVRGGYPYRDYSSTYSGPGYAYAGYDDGNNYYAYH